MFFMFYICNSFLATSFYSSLLSLLNSSSSSSFIAMKQGFHVFLVFFSLLSLLLSHSISARSLPKTQGEKEGKLHGVVHTTTISEDLMKLMGSDWESCDDKDEECLKRRMVAEAHLDYIYTQHNKP